MLLLSTAFKNYKDIPVKYTGDGEEISPPLRWQDTPDTTRSLALICEDPDAPGGTFDHWILYNIPPTISVLPGDMKTLQHGIRSCLNSKGTGGYVGPKPPDGRHRYFFTLYALETVLQLPNDAHKADLLKAMLNCTLAQATLVGYYESPKK